MEVRSSYPDYKTIRQWALQGYLPEEGAEGKELWANQFRQDKYVYYSPDEVCAATKEQLHDYFRPERERRNALARDKLLKQRKLEKEEAKRLLKLEQDEMIRNTVQPYIERIAELQRVIKVISSDKATGEAGSQIIVLDTETTGLDPEKDELLQVSIIDGNGNTLFNSYFNPCVKSWDGAQRVNGISPDMVKDAPRISDKLVDINSILCGAKKIIGYNTSFDIEFLANNGVYVPHGAEMVDVMEMFAPIFGEWSDHYESYKWQKLTTAAAYYEYDWNSHPFEAHNSLADCYATLYVYNRITALQSEQGIRS